MGSKPTGDDFRRIFFSLPCLEICPLDVGGKYKSAGKYLLLASEGWRKVIFSQVCVRGWGGTHFQVISQDGTGVPPLARTGVPPSGRTERALDTWRTVCLLRPPRRNFFFQFVSKKTYTK